MTEDIFILDCQTDIFVWVGQNVDSKNKLQAFKIGEVLDINHHSIPTSYWLQNDVTVF